MRFRYRVDLNSTFSRLNRRKTTLTLTIPGRWNLDPDDMAAYEAATNNEERDEILDTLPNTGNEYSTQFAVEAAERLKLANENILDDDRFLEAVNAIIFIYITHYHYMDTLYYGKIDHGQEPDWQGRSDTIERETYAHFQDTLRKAASRLRDIPIENFTGWGEYYQYW